MTIIDGRNEYGFHAAKVPDSSLEKTAPGKYNITLRGGDGKDIVVNATAPENGKKTNFWLISFEEGNYNVICVQRRTVQSVRAERIHVCYRFIP